MRASAPLALLCVLAAPIAARAEPAWRVDAALGAVSDYRWRGVSQTEGDPAVQGEVTVSGGDGVYFTAWASNVAAWRETDGRGRGQASGALGRAAKAVGSDQALELSATLGRVFDIGPYHLDLAISRYGYPGGPAGYLEIPVNVSRSFGPAILSAGLAWAPPQPGTSGRGDRYLYLAAAWSDAGWPLRPRVSLGQEAGGFGPSKIDWSAGFTAEYGRLGFSLDLVGADRGEGSALVAGIQRRF